MKISKSIEKKLPTSSFLLYLLLRERGEGEVSNKEIKEEQPHFTDHIIRKGFNDLEGVGVVSVKRGFRNKRIYKFIEI